MNDREKLWAPWRKKYLNSQHSDDCIFCTKSSEDKDAENYIIFRGSEVFALLNLYPYNNGHVMIAPYLHTGNYLELSRDTLIEINEISKEIIKKIESEMNPQGFNIGMNIGKCSGAGFDQHLHLHIVPRWNGDTNFMPVISDTDVISESLDSVYSRLKFYS